MGRGNLTYIPLLVYVKVVYFYLEDLGHFCTLGFGSSYANALSFKVL